jgi:hypothetical protein
MHSRYSGIVIPLFCFKIQSVFAKNICTDCKTESGWIRDRVWLGYDILLKWGRFAIGWHCQQTAWRHLGWPTRLSKAGKTKEILFRFLYWIHVTIKEWFPVISNASGVGIRWYIKYKLYSWWWTNSPKYIKFLLFIVQFCGTSPNEPLYF